MKRTVSFFAVVCLLWTSLAQAQLSPPISEITGVRPNTGVFKIAGRDKPLVLETPDAAAAHFSSESMGMLSKQVDFDRQIVLVFAWRGSGQDRITYSVLESFPEQIVFAFRPGRTRDLRPHTKVYVLRSNVKWKTPAGAGARAKSPVADYIKVEIRGKLSTGVLAIGGETTGITISSRGINWELDFSGNPTVRKNVGALNGKTVVVSGELSVSQGVERKTRWIVKVSSIGVADSKSQASKSVAPENVPKSLGSAKPKPVAR